MIPWHVISRSSVVSLLHVNPYVQYSWWHSTVYKQFHFVEFLLCFINWLVICLLRFFFASFLLIFCFQFFTVCNRLPCTLWTPTNPMVCGNVDWWYDCCFVVPECDELQRSPLWRTMHIKVIFDCYLQVLYTAMCSSTFSWRTSVVSYCHFVRLPCAVLLQFRWY